MMLHELNELADAIEAASHASSKDGVAATVKPVPDALREHALDPRVKSRIETRLAAKKNAGGNDGAFSLRATRKPPTFDDGLYGTESTVEERLIEIDGDHRINVFLVRPKDLTPGRPVLIQFHGGGFTMGGFAWQEPQMRAIAERSGCMIVYPEYRLAPECPFPGPVRDAWGTVLWVRDHAEELGIDSDHIVLSGDSAGGSLVNACVLLDIERSAGGHGARLVHHVFEVYPSFDWRAAEEQSDYPWSLDLYDMCEDERELVVPRILNIKRCRERRLGTPVDLYFQGADVSDPLASVVCAEDDVLAEFPPAVIAVAAYDYLRIVDEYMARRFARLRVPVELIEYEGIDHGFLDKFQDHPQSLELCRTIAADLAACAQS